MLHAATAMLAATSAAAASRAERLTPAEVAAWRADLHALATALATRHRDPFFRVRRTTFDSTVRALDAAMPTYDRDRALVALMRVVALLHDGHTTLDVVNPERLTLHAVPLRLHWFDDGLFVRAASPPFRDLVGARVLRIGRVPVDAVLDSVALIVPHENEFWVRAAGPRLLRVAELAHGLGLADDATALTLEVERDGVRRTVRVPASEPLRHAANAPSDWIDMRDAAPGPDPLWLREPTTPFWMTRDSASNTLYVGYNAIAPEADGVSNEAFFRRALDTADSAHVARVVLDLRNNGGGNGGLNRHAVRAIVQHPAYDRRDRLFVIIGPQTFSAAKQLVNELMTYTNATLVGEPTGNAPMQYGDNQPTSLPRSGLTVRISTRVHASEIAREDQPYFAPSIAAPLTSDDYRRRIDPAMRAVLASADRKPLADLLGDALARGDTAGARAAFTAYRAAPANRYVNVEAQGNAAGYALLGQGRARDAVSVFELVVAAFPSSGNAHDSLGEGYERAGMRERAIAAYRRALALDPRLVSSRDGLQRLGATP